MTPLGTVAAIVRDDRDIGYYAAFCKPHWYNHDTPTSVQE